MNHTYLLIAIRLRQRLETPCWTKAKPNHRTRARVALNQTRSVLFAWSTRLHMHGWIVSTSVLYSALVACAFLRMRASKRLALCAARFRSWQRTACPLHSASLESLPHEIGATEHVARISIKWCYRAHCIAPLCQAHAVLDPVETRKF